MSDESDFDVVAHELGQLVVIATILRGEEHQSGADATSLWN